MRPLRYSINVTLDGCCDHRVMLADERLVLTLVSRQEFRSGAVVLRYQPSRVTA